MIYHNYSGCTVVDYDNQTEGPDFGPMGFAQVVWICIGPVIFTVGIIGNVLILAVMSKRFLSGTTTSVFLRTMATADIFALITGMIPEILEAGRIVILKELHPFTCKMEKFLFYTSADTSLWILVVFTIDRFLAVWFPLNFRGGATSLSKSKMAVAGAFFAASLKNLHVFWTRGAEYHLIGDQFILVSNCGHPSLLFKHFECHIRPWIVLALVDAGPFCFILLSNIFIILKIRQLLSDEQIMSSSSCRQLLQMCLMCVSASVCFLICISPSIVLLIGRPKWAHSSVYSVAKAFNNVLVYIHHSANFFLYCLTGKRFRAALGTMFNNNEPSNQMLS